jgi:DNA polymerase (family 10)
MTNSEASAALQTIARILTLLEENPFKIRAYERVAMSLESAEEIDAVYKRAGVEGFRGIAGVGQDIALKLEELVTTGKLTYLEKLRAEVPAGLFEVMEIPGMGPKKTAFLWKQFDVKGAEDVEKLLAANKLDGLKGWGDKSIENLKRGIEVRKHHSGRFRRDVAQLEVDRILGVLRRVKGCERAEAAGSLRRGRETVGDIDILTCGKNAEALIDAFLGVEGVADQLAKGDTRAAIRLQSGLQADLRVVSKESFGAALHYFTGSKEHNVRLRQLGIEKGLTINEYGVHKGSAEKKGKLMASETEEDIYAAVGLPWIPPTLREDRGEIDAAKAGKLPTLIERADLKGDLHMHSDWSDGSATIVEMAQAAKDAGHEYIAITDHASPMGMVRGTKDGNIDEYLAKVEDARKKVPGIRILAGAEVDILPDGSLYLRDNTLNKLDWINASIHAHFKLDKAAQTERFLAAIRNKHVHCIAHPMTRMVAERDPIEADWDAVFEAAAASGVAIEMNASVRRLDLNDALARRAKEKGVTFTLGSDAHAIIELDTSHGVLQAQRAWLTKEDFLVCKPWKDLEKWLKKRRGA